MTDHITEGIIEIIENLNNTLKLRIMKNQKLNLVIVILLMASMSFAQRGYRQMNASDDAPLMRRNCNLTFLDLSEEQETNIKSIRLGADKKIIPLRNEIREKRAKLVSLQSSDNYDKKAVNQIIDEIAAKQAQIRKINAEKHKSVRNLLNEEQKVQFDKHFSNRKMRMHKKGMRRGNGPRGNYPDCPRRSSN